MHVIKNQECKVREVVVKSEHMNFPHDIKVNRCSGNCNNITNPYPKMCVPNIVKNVTVKMFDLMTLTNKAKQVIFHESCKCICRLDPIACNNKQRWNKNKCRCECLIKKSVMIILIGILVIVHVSTKKAAKLTTDTTKITQNKTIVIKELVESCKTFVASSILFLSVSTILTGFF